MASSDTQSAKRLLRLAPQDNIAVATSEVAAGEDAVLDGQIVRALDRIATGHKIAVVPISAGTKVLKFGCPIGSATADISVGRHVHTHNLKSDYIPTFTLEKGQTFVRE